MKQTLIIGAVLAYVLLSAFLQTEEGGRLVPADLWLAALSALTLVVCLGRQRAHVPAAHLAALPLFVVFTFGALGALNQARAAFELVVILFGFLGSLALANLLLPLGEKGFSTFCRLYLLLLGGLSLICLVDFLVLPGLVSARSLGGLQGTFRNTGQAGSFFAVHAAIGAALIASGIVPRRPLYLACALALIIALLCTLKRAAVIGFVAGLVLVLLQILLSASKRDKKIAIGVLAFGGLAAVAGTVLFQWAIENVEGFRWRFEYKFSEDAAEDFATGFFQENLESALAALVDSPVFGVGLDNVREVYQHHEIHSTYLAILAYGGLLGVLAYVLFMGALLRTILSGARYRLESPYSAFLYYMAPMFLGLVVSWAYTYHLRKREFWLLVVFIVLARVFATAAHRARPAPRPLPPPAMVLQQG